MKRSKFSLSHYRLFSADLGELIPCGLVEVLPGDTVQHATSALVRASPLLAPVMHPVHVRIHHWFVPHRLVWDSWEDFITGGPDGEDDSAFPYIQLSDSTGGEGSLADYLGVPKVTASADLPVSALPFRGYALIWNEWYRDQDLQTELVVSTADGGDSTTNKTLQNCCWEKDYFTSARPWDTKGASITLPLGTTAPVTGIGIVDGVASSATDRTVRESGSTGTTVYSDTFDPTNTFFKAETTGNSGSGNKLQIFADLSNASAVSINVLREALALQRYQEARARYGSRYTEYLRYLGVRSSDARLQRPEYLGGGKQTVQFSEVLQTSGNATPAADDQLGQLGGHGIAAMRSNRYRRFFEEHGYVFSLMSVKPQTMYKDGLPRHWNRRTKEDFWQKELQFIGQQEILNKEIYANIAQGTGSGQQDFTWGYQDRYDEYRRMESGIAGEFRSTLNFWHFARHFTSLPTLNSDFVKSSPVETPFAVPSTDVVWCMTKHSIQARRMVAPVGVSKTF